MKYYVTGSIAGCIEEDDKGFDTLEEAMKEKVELDGEENLKNSLWIIVDENGKTVVE